MKKLGISVYFMWEWWEKYFHLACHQQNKTSDDILAEIYLQRKRFLFEKFGAFGIGEENPVMDGRYVNMVIKWGMDFIPYILGAELVCQDTGGYAAKKMDISTIKKLKPIDLSATSMGEWIVERKSELLKRYASVSQMIQLEGPTNIAVRLRGEEFYIDLIEDKGLAKGLLEVVTETICSSYEFLGKEFMLSNLHLANCNVTLMSPELYMDMILEYDIRLASLAPIITGKKNSLSLHHCDVPIDKFIEAYTCIPGICNLEASYKSDISRVCNEIPGALFSAMVNPVELMQTSPARLEIDLDRAIKSGASVLDIWNIDPSSSFEGLNTLFSTILRCCERNERKAEFDVIPFCWDELEWAFPQYQKSRVYNSSLH